MIQISNIEWEDTNLLRKYPISEDSTCIDDSGKTLDTGILQDLSIVTYTDLVNPRIGSVFLSESLASVSIVDDIGTVAVFTEPGAVTGESLWPVQARPGVFSRLTLGNNVGRTRLVFSSYKQSGIHDFCIVSAKSTSVTGFVDDSSGNEFTGKISLVFGSGIRSEIKNDKSECTTVVLQAADSLEKTLSSGCVPTSLNKSCVAPVIQTINGVSPNEYGEIAIVLE